MHTVLGGLSGEGHQCVFYDFQTGKLPKRGGISGMVCYKMSLSGHKTVFVNEDSYLRLPLHTMKPNGMKKLVLQDTDNDPTVSTEKHVSMSPPLPSPSTHSGGA